MSGTTTLPFSWYVDDAQLRIERAHIFARSWQYAGRAAEVAEPGSYLTTDAGGVSCSRHARRSRASCGRSSTSAAIAARCSPTAAAGEAPSSATTTRGRTASTARCARRRGRSASRASIRPTGRSCRRASAPGGRSSSSTRRPTACRSPSTSAICPSILARDIDLDALVFHSRVEFGVERELEDRRRELPRVLPLRDRASGVQRRGRRAPRPLPARGASHVLRPVLPLEVDRRARAVPPALSEHGHQRLPGAAEPLDRPDRAGRDDPHASATSTTSSPRTPTRPGSREFFAFDDQVGREDTALVESVQRGVSSGALEHGRLLLNAEPLLAAFQSWVADAVRPQSPTRSVSPSSATEPPSSSITSRATSAPRSRTSSPTRRARRPASPARARACGRPRAR